MNLATPSSGNAGTLRNTPMRPRAAAGRLMSASPSATPSVAVTAPSRNATPSRATGTPALRC